MVWYFKCDVCKTDTGLNELRTIAVHISQNRQDYILDRAEKHTLDLCKNCFKPSKDIIMKSFKGIKRID